MCINLLPFFSSPHLFEFACNQTEKLGRLPFVPLVAKTLSLDGLISVHYSYIQTIFVYEIQSLLNKDGI